MQYRVGVASSASMTCRLSRWPTQPQPVPPTTPGPRVAPPLHPHRHPACQVRSYGSTYSCCGAGTTWHWQKQLLGQRVMIRCCSEKLRQTATRGSFGLGLSCWSLRRREVPEGVQVHPPLDLIAMQTVAATEVKALVEARRGLIAQLSGCEATQTRGSSIVA